MIDTQQQYK